MGHSVPAGLTMCMRGGSERGRARGGTPTPVRVRPPSRPAARVLASSPCRPTVGHSLGRRAGTGRAVGDGRSGKEIVAVSSVDDSGHQRGVSSDVDGGER